MHKYILAIENYDFSTKDKSKSIMEIIKYYEGEMDDATNETLYIGFPNELKMLCANGSLFKIGVCCNIRIEGINK